MSTTRKTSLLSSSEKKRLRDRKAQQTLREKRQKRMLELEARVAFCEKTHGVEGTLPEIMSLHPGQERAHGRHIQELLDTVEKLRLENNRLRERQQSLRQMIGAWDECVDHTDFEPDAMQMRHNGRGGIRKSCGTYEDHAMSEIKDWISSSPSADDHYLISSSPEAISMKKTDSAFLFSTPAPEPPMSNYQFAGSISSMGSPQHLPPSPQPIIQLPSPPALSSVPNWCRVPRDGYKTKKSKIYSLILSPWYSHPELITISPMQPSPLDLLHGTRRNYLASCIHGAIRSRAIQDPECIALGYLYYNYSKWRVSPTPATFARLAHFQHPLPIQFELEHFDGIDTVIWPQMRINMIRHWGEIDILEMFGFLAVCMKVRWPWNKDMMERDADNNLQLRDDFKKTFYQESGWGLTTEFIDRYPMLLEGMDVEALRYEITFPTELNSHVSKVI